jgi:hypothetical protein
MQWRRELAWNPRDLGWRIAALFMVGSLLFALGSFPLYWGLVDARVVGLTFFVGSLFFTAAGYSTFYQVINSTESSGRDAAAGPRFWAWRPRGMAWWSAFVQLVGTLFFNLNTFDAMLTTRTVEQTNRLVWAPDFFGSIAFLVASHLAWLMVCQRLWCVRREDADWWIAGLNYLGSIFFMASAIAAFTLPTSGEVVNITVVNVGTFLGAVCFFVGAYLLLPPAKGAREQTRAH